MVQSSRVIGGSMAEGKIYEAISAVMADVGAVGKDKLISSRNITFVELMTL